MKKRAEDIVPRTHTDEELAEMDIQLPENETDGDFFGAIDEMIHEALDDPKARKEWEEQERKRLERESQ